MWTLAASLTLNKRLSTFSPSTRPCPYYFLSLRSPLSTQHAINDIGSAEDFLAAIEGTIKNFNDGDLVSGIVVQIDREEVLLDIGYKTEGVIPSRELSIRHDIDQGWRSY